nr:Pycsar system effector family protein [Streptomyces thermoviolaceus]
MLAAVVTLAGSDHGLGISGAFARTVLWAGVALLAVSVVLAVLAVLPRHDREGHRRPAHRDDFVFYGHIRHLTPAELEESLREHDPLPALSRQIVAMSRILWIKQRLVRQSLLVAVGGGALIAVGALTG